MSGESKEKPPVGLRPRNIVIVERLQEIEQAMSRYMVAHILIPQAWFDEYSELRDKLMEISDRESEK